LAVSPRKENYQLSHAKKGTNLSHRPLSFLIPFKMPGVAEKISGQLHEKFISQKPLPGFY
jgi:hypothetical protein